MLRAHPGHGPRTRFWLWVHRRCEHVYHYQDWFTCGYHCHSHRRTRVSP
jgi:hypothetical protein